MTSFKPLYLTHPLQGKARLQRGQTIIELGIVVCPLIGLGIGIDIGHKHGLLGGVIGGIVGFAAGLLAYPIVMFIFFLPCLIANIPPFVVNQVAKMRTARNDKPDDKAH